MNTQKVNGVRLLVHLKKFDAFVQTTRRQRLHQVKQRHVPYCFNSGLISLSREQGQFLSYAGQLGGVLEVNGQTGKKKNSLRMPDSFREPV